MLDKLCTTEDNGRMEPHEDRKEAATETDGRPTVQVMSLLTNESKRFHATWESTLQEVWDEGYEELGEARGPQHQLQCSSGESLMGYLSKTLADLRDEHVCPDRKFEIRGPTGGA